MALIGILGAGQLGRMLALAGYPLGHRFRFLDPAKEAPAEQLARRIVGGYDDLDSLNKFLDGLDVITYEFENVSVSSVRFLEQHVPVYPPPQALEAAQDRLIEKQFLNRLGVPTAPFVAVNSREELQEAANKLHLPAILKTRRLGYDGKGQIFLSSADDLPRAWEKLMGWDLILEGLVPFERELSLIMCRNIQGEVVFYPLVQNHHREGMLRLSLGPAPNLTRQLQAEAEDIGRRVLTELNYVGTLAIEMFQMPRQQGQPRLLVNEMAPRVHNSGHWTIEGAATSQFENHLRAIRGWPLGSTEVQGSIAMVNLIGTMPRAEDVLALHDAHLHDYAKGPRQGRKLGHLTLRAKDAQSRDDLLARAQSILGIESFD